MNWYMFTLEAAQDRIDVIAQEPANRETTVKGAYMEKLGVTCVNNHGK